MWTRANIGGTIKDFYSAGEHVYACCQCYNDARRYAYREIKHDQRYDGSDKWTVAMDSQRWLDINQSMIMWLSDVHRARAGRS